MCCLCMLHVTHSHHVLFMYVIMLLIAHHVLFMYGTAHVQVYKQTCVMRHALRNFEDNARVGLVRHEEYTAHERLLMS